MIAVDTSVTVAGFAAWHDKHGVARAVLARHPRLPAHAAVETFSVLTRLPGAVRLMPSEVRTLLLEAFSEPVLTLPAAAHRKLLGIIAEEGVAGGAVYDALIGFTALHAGAALLSLDRRALTTYRAVGADARLVTD